MRVGFGYDVHRLVEGRELWLGGVLIPHSKGLLGHSDADVLLHAICDALLGAADHQMLKLGVDVAQHIGEFPGAGEAGRHRLDDRPLQPAPKSSHPRAQQP